MFYVLFPKSTNSASTALTQCCRFSRHKDIPIQCHAKMPFGSSHHLPPMSLQPHIIQISINYYNGIEPNETNWIWIKVVLFVEQILSCNLSTSYAIFGAEEKYLVSYLNYSQCNRLLRKSLQDPPTTIITSNQPIHHLNLNRNFATH